MLGLSVQLHFYGHCVISAEFLLKKPDAILAFCNLLYFQDMFNIKSDLSLSF